MSKSNKDNQCFTQEESSPVESSESSPKKEKKIFAIFHKKTEILISENESKSKNSQSIKFKCFYCRNQYNKINRFEAHMKLHVSQNIFNLFFILYYRLGKSLTNADFAIKLSQKKEI